MCVSWISQSSLTTTDKQLEEQEPVKEIKYSKLTERKTWTTVVKTAYISVSKPEVSFRSSQESLATAHTNATDSTLNTMQQESPSHKHGRS